MAKKGWSSGLLRNLTILAFFWVIDNPQKPYFIVSIDFHQHLCIPVVLEKFYPGIPSYINHNLFGTPDYSLWCNFERLWFFPLRNKLMKFIDLSHMNRAVKEFFYFGDIFELLISHLLRFRVIILIWCWDGRGFFGLKILLLPCT